MNKVILLVLDDSDVAAIPKVAEILREMRPEGIWIIHSPHIGVTDTALLADFDKDIAALDAQVLNASTRRDFVAAASYNQALDQKKMERDLALRDGWRAVPEAKRQAMYDKILKPFHENVSENVMISTLREACAHAGSFEMLGSFKTAWPAQLPHGSYIVTWASGLRPFHSNGASPAAAPPANVASFVVTEETELNWNELTKEAKTLGISYHGVKKEQLAENIKAAKAALEKHALLG